MTRNRRQDAAPRSATPAPESDRGDRQADAEAARRRRPLRNRGPARNRRRARRQRDRRRRRAEERFVPEETKWLEESEVSAALGAVSGSSARRNIGRPRPRPGRRQRQRHRTGAEETARGAAEETAGSRSAKCKTRANRPRTGSRSRSRSTAATTIERTSNASTPAKPPPSTIPLTPAPKGEVTLEVEGRTGARRAGLRKQRSQLHGRLRIGGCGDADRLPRPGRHLHRGRAAARRRGRPSSSRCARRRSTTRSSPSSDGRGRAGAGPLRELDRGLGPRHPRHPRLRAPSGDDRRRARLRGAGPPDRPRADRARARSRRSSPTPSRWPSAPASCASSLPEVELPQRQQHRGGGAMVASRRGPGRRSAPARRPSSTAATILREGVEDEADNVTRFVWIAPAGTEPAGGGPWKTSLVFSELGEDHPGALVDALREFSSRGDQPEPDRVAAAAPGPRPLHVLLRPRGGARPTERSPRRSRALRAKADSVRILGSYPVG